MVQTSSRSGEKRERCRVSFLLGGRPVKKSNLLGFMRERFREGGGLSRYNFASCALVLGRGNENNKLERRTSLEEED